MQLNLKYRPKNFKDVVGSEATLAALKAVFDRDKGDIPHAMLFTGPSGCGKTTLARIVARKLKCSSNDLRELDSADFRGIDTVREIRKQIQYLPTDGPCRVWILDECHKLTADAQEALLKAFEDAPSHVYFLPATTNPEKLKVALKRRCMEFPVESLTEDEVIEFLGDIIQKEEKKVPEKILELIADQCLGSPGIALMALDKIIDLDKKKMEKVVKQVVEEKVEGIALVRALIQGTSWGKIRLLLRGLENPGESTRQLILAYCNSVLLTEDNPKAFLILDSFSEPFYNNKNVDLTIACYEVTKGDG